MPDINSPKAIFTAVLLSSVGASMFMVQPVFLGVIADQLGFDSKQLGLVAGLELAGLGTAAFTAVFWVRRVHWRVAAVVAISLIVALNLVAAVQTTFTAVATLRLLTGLAEGSVYAVFIAAIGDTLKTDRNFAYSIVGTVSYGIVGLILFPHIAEAWGMFGFLVGLAAYALAVLPFVVWLPAKGVKDTGAVKIAVTGTPAPVLMGLAVQLIWYLGVGTVWVFLERLGSDAGLARTEIGNALAIGMAIGLAGAFAAIWIGDRFGRIAPFAVAIIGQVIVLWLLSDIANWVVYVAAVSGYNTTWNLASPYLLGVITNSDTSGRLAVLILTAQTIGTTAGAILAGFLISNFGLVAVLYLGAVSAVIALGVFAILVKKIPSAGSSTSPTPEYEKL